MENLKDQQIEAQRKTIESQERKIECMEKELQKHLDPDSGEIRLEWKTSAKHREEAEKLELWEIVNQYIDMNDGPDYIQTRIVDTGVILENFVWSQIQKKESCPSDVLDEETFSALFTLITNWSRMYKKVLAKLYEEERKKEKDA